MCFALHFQQPLYPDYIPRLNILNSLPTLTDFEIQIWLSHLKSEVVQYIIYYQMAAAIYKLYASISNATDKSGLKTIKSHLNQQDQPAA